MQKNDLAKCKCCGSEKVKLISKDVEVNSLITQRRDKRKRYHVKCLSCHATGGKYFNEAEAIESWNTDKGIDIVETPQELFLKMLGSSDYCREYEVSNGTIEYDGEECQTNIIRCWDMNNRQIDAVFLRSTEDFISFKVGSREEIAHKRQTETHRRIVVG